MDDQTPDAPDRAAIRRRCGRPAKPDHERRRHHIGFYVTTAELEVLHAEAVASRTDSLSDHARRTLCRIAERTPDRPRQSCARELHSAAAVAELTHIGLSLKALHEEARAGNCPATVGAAADEALNALGQVLWALADNPRDSGP